VKKITVGFIVIFAISVFVPVFAGAAPSSVDLLKDAKRSVALVDNKTPLVWQKVFVFEKAGKQDVTFRTVFQVDNPGQFVCLSLKKPLHIKDLTLNGKKIPVPLEGMKYKTIPGIPVIMLKKGSNTLQATWTQKVVPRKGKGKDKKPVPRKDKKKDAKKDEKKDNKKDKKIAKVSVTPKHINAADLDIHLFGMTPSALTFQTGAVMGYADENFFTVSCRVNIPAEVVLEVQNDNFYCKYVSKPGLLHSFKVALAANTKYHYSLNARLSSKEDFTASVGPYPVRTLPAGGSGISGGKDKKFTFAILGDSRTHPKDWAKVAAAVVAKKPVLVVFVGDMVTAGRTDHQWDEQYFSPAKDFFATIPYFAVIGNHEQNAPLFPLIFQTPGGGKNWSQEVGSVLLIGIDGSMDWESGSDLTKWLEDILAKSKAKFIFLNTHYPAWSSGPHSKLNKAGRPRQKSARVAQNVLMPLLKKYNATAMFAGHEHFYERSEPTDGVTMIVTGGAGAPLYGKVENAEKQNPYSKVFASEHHYTLLTVDGDVCTMKVLTPEGKVIDTRTWTARKGK